MKIQQQKEVELLPEGTYPAILVEMIDLGRSRNQYMGADKGPALRAQAIFQLEELNSFDERYILSSNTFNISWGTKSKWPPFVQSVVGASGLKRALETEEFDPYAMELTPVLLNIGHNVRDKDGQKRTYLEIIGVSPMPKGMKPIAKEGYILQRDRPDYVPANPGAFEDVLSDVISTAPKLVNFKEEPYTPWGDYSPDVPRVWKKDYSYSEMEPWNGDGGTAQFSPVSAAPSTRPAAPAVNRTAEREQITGNNPAHSSKAAAKAILNGEETPRLAPNRQPQPVAAGGVEDEDEIDSSIFDNE